LAAVAASGTAQVAVIEGDPGSGKTALCHQTADRAADTGFRVIRAAGVQGEADLPLAGLSLLLRPLISDLDDLAGRLPPGQQRAIKTAAGLCDEPIADRFTLGAALLGLATASAEHMPLLIVIDDAQWLDRSSADAISFAARRLGADAVMMLVATRPNECPLQLGSDVTHSAIGGLNKADVADLLTDAGIPTTPPVLAAVLAATGGVPLAVLETTRAVTPEQRAGRDPLPDPLPIGRDVTSAYRARLEQLPERARRAVTLAAAAGSAPTKIIAQALATTQLDITDLRAAEDSGVLAITASHIAFAHPLLRAAALHLPTPTQRRTAHQALADAYTTDPEQRARHLAAATTGPDEHVAAALEQAATEVTRRAGLPAAAPLLAKAAAFTPSSPQLTTRQLAAARALGLSGQPDHALALAREVSTHATDPAQRLDATVVSLTTSMWSSDADSLVNLALDQASAIAAADPMRAVQALLQAAMLSLTRGHLHRADELVRRALELITIEVSARHAITAKLTAAAALVLRGGHTEARTLLLGWAPPSPRRLSSIEIFDIIYPSTVQTLVRLGRYDDAEFLFHALLATSNQQSVPSTKAHLLGTGAELLWWQGRWPQSAALGEQSVALAEQTGQRNLMGYIGSGNARTWASLGNDARCRAAVADSLAICLAADNWAARMYPLAALGLLELGVGAPESALAPLREANEIRRAIGCRDPACVPLGPDLIEALTRAGHSDEARDTLAEYTELTENAATPWGLATTARCRALLSTDPDEAGTQFATAIELHPPEVPFDTARTQLYWGQHLRRHRDITASRTHLEQATATFEHLGAKPWAQRAAAELRAAGGKTHTPRTSDLTNLSPQEMHCALAAAEGHSNRDIAAAMFISPKTVEYHLRKAYTKLGITSRTQLNRIVLDRTKTK
jgi:DNA-binding CsgD family transcriptional regulator